MVVPSNERIAYVPSSWDAQTANLRQVGEHFQDELRRIGLVLGQPAEAAVVVPPDPVEPMLLRGVARCDAAGVVTNFGLDDLSVTTTATGRYVYTYLGAGDVSAVVASASTFAAVSIGVGGYTQKGFTVATRTQAGADANLAHAVMVYVTEAP